MLKSIPSSKLFSDVLSIVCGALLQAVSYVLFVAPYKIVPGGIYGITIVLNNITKGVFSFAPDGLPMGIMALFFNIPLMIIAARKLGLQSGGKTVLAFVLIAVFTDLIDKLSGGVPVVKDDALLSCFYGGVILGLGVFLVIRAGGTCAGTDVVARLLSKRFNYRLSSMVIIVDSAIVVLGLLAFNDWTVPLYSWIVIFVYGKVIDTLQVVNPNNLMMIVADNIDQMRDFILYEVKRGGTVVDAKGMYTYADKKVIFVVVSKREADAIEARIKSFDENAFCVMVDAYNIKGNGYVVTPH